jgi:hypothetical protein
MRGEGAGSHQRVMREIAKASRGNRAHRRKRVLDAMMQLFQDQPLKLIRSFTLLGIDAGLGQQRLGLSLACVSNSRKLTFSAVRISRCDEGSNAGPAVFRLILSMTPSHRGLVAKIEAAENDAGRSSFELLRLEFAGRALFDLIAQPQELFVALIRLCLHATLQIVHRRTADGAGYFPATMQSWKTAAPFGHGQSL